MSSEKIDFLKEQLIKWKKEMLDMLSNKIYRKLDIYLVKQKYLKNFEEMLLNSNNKDNKDQLKQSLKKNDSIINDSNEILNIFNKPENINKDKLPRIFPLNKELYKFFSQLKLNKDNNSKYMESFKCYFGDGLLKIKINELLYLFFFVENDHLRQGYLQVKNENSDWNIMNEIERNGPSYFVKNFTGDKINEKECEINENDFYLYIFPKYDINIEKVKIDFEKMNEEKELKFLSKSMPVSVFNLNKNIKELITQVEENYNKCSNKLINIFRGTIQFRNSRSKSINKYPVNNFHSTILNKENNINNVIHEEEENNNIDNNEIGETQFYIKKANISNNLKDTNVIINNINDEDEYKDIKKNYLTEVEPKIEMDYERNPSIDETPAVLIGLSNIGATCYMNATLQCFNNIVFLRDELLVPEFYSKLEENKASKMRLSFALAEVLKNLWFNYNIKYYPPEHFKETISDMNPLFRGIAANDPKDLILFMLETIHSELKTVNPNIIVDENFVPDEHNLLDVYKDFSNYYLSKNKSIIFDIFYGCSNIVTSCINCKSEIHNVQVNNIIFFPLEEVRKYKHYDSQTPVTINDCFEYNQKYDLYQSYYCNACHNNNSQAISFTRNLYSPKVIIINLNRGKGIQFNVKINFEEFIDIKKFVYAQESPYKYELIGVICHFGESGMGGHFIAFCKRFNNYGYQWYKFNDAMVDECTFNDVKTSGMPYVLVYSYLDL